MRRRVLTDFFSRQERLFESVTIALVGKYTDMQDSYMSVVKSLEHSAFRCSRKLILKVCDSHVLSIFSVSHVVRIVGRLFRPRA